MSAERNQLLNLNFNKEITRAPGLKKKYLVPDDVLIASGGTGIVTEDLLCTTGAALANDLVANPSLGHRYLGISTEGDGKFGHRVSFDPRSLFGLWSIGKLHYTAQFNVKNLKEIRSTPTSSRRQGNFLPGTRMMLQHEMHLRSFLQNGEHMLL